ncbi:hypothetical protein V6N11_012744 [Hibiscus sabdariffa]|uniref:Uncharacterized protein n=1 Tax=Hibiscus sabdariffa TaxID=183260 RepID=A0ABR2A3S4_9ROSI
MVFSGAGWTPGSGVPPVELCFYRLAHRWKQPTADPTTGEQQGVKEIQMMGCDAIQDKLQTQCPKKGITL